MDVLDRELTRRVNGLLQSIMKDCFGESGNGCQGYEGCICGGKGGIPIYPNGIENWLEQQPCKMCNGSGSYDPHPGLQPLARNERYLHNAPCLTCHGSGKAPLYPALVWDIGFGELKLLGEQFKDVEILYEHIFALTPLQALMICEDISAKADIIVRCEHIWQFGKNVYRASFINWPDKGGMHTLSVLECDTPEELLAKILEAKEA